MPAVADLDTVAHITKFTLGTFPAAIAKYAEAFSNDIRARYLSDCSSHSDLSKITQRLQQRGWSDADILKFLGGNFLRAFGDIWDD
jgi:microsomal dipeptidase-like Zn-dependent dipeptidase